MKRLKEKIELNREKVKVLKWQIHTDEYMNGAIDRLATDLCSYLYPSKRMAR